MKSKLFLKLFISDLKSIWKYSPGLLLVLVFMTFASLVLAPLAILNLLGH